MSELETKNSNAKLTKTSPDNNDSDKINDCDKSESKSGLFKLNGWKTTLLIVLVIKSNNNSNNNK